MLVTLRIQLLTDEMLVKSDGRPDTLHDDESMSSESQLRTPISDVCSPPDISADPDSSWRNIISCDSRHSSPNIMVHLSVRKSVCMSYLLTCYSCTKTSKCSSPFSKTCLHKLHGVHGLHDGLLDELNDLQYLLKSQPPSLRDFCWMFQIFSLAHPARFFSTISWTCTQLFTSQRIRQIQLNLGQDMDIVTLKKILPDILSMMTLLED